MSRVRAAAGAHDLSDAPRASADLTDEFLASYVVWRESCEAVDDAYDYWDRCEPPLRGTAFGSYRAALAWEEFAAEVHSDRTGRLRASQALKT
jgi:hypothetical protein